MRKDKDNHLPLSRRIFNVLCVLVIVLIGFFGIRYAAGRDLNNGINKVGEAAEGEEFWTPLEKGQARETVVTVGHNFNGVSLAVNYTAGAVFRTVDVSITDAASGETVLERSIPVWCLHKGQVNFFAAQNVIPSAQPTAYVVRVASGGVGGGRILLKSGISSASFNSDGDGRDNVSGEILYGIVTDYQRNPHYDLLTGAAVLILCGWLLILLIFTNTWKKKNPGHKRENEKRRRLLFFISYFVVATSLEFLALTFDTDVTYAETRLGSPAGTVELKDDTTLDQNFILPGNCVTGVTLHSFDTNDLVFTDEKLHFTVTDVLTGQDVQQGTILLADVEVNDDGQGDLYIPFDDRYNDQTFLAVHLTSEGLVSKGVLFGTAWTDGDDAHLYLSGERQDYILDVSLPNAGYVVSHRKTILLYAGVLILDAGLWILASKKKIPVWIRNEKGIQSGEEAAGNEEVLLAAWENNGLERNKGILTRRNLIGFAITAGLGLLLIEWSYSTSISRAVVNVAPYIASYANASEEWNRIPSSGESLTQTFTAEEDQMAGVGLQISAGDLTQDSLEAVGDSSLRVVLRDDNGNVLSDIVYSASELRRVGEVTNSEYRYDNNNPVARAGLTGLFRYFAFEEVIPDSAGKTYELSISQSANGASANDFENTSEDVPEAESADGAGESAEVPANGTEPAEGMLLIAQKPASEGGSANLLTLYEEYQVLPTFFFTVCLLSLAMLCLLYWGTRRESARLLPLYFFTALTAGVVFSFVIPINLVPDEADHIGSIYQLSNRALGVSQAAGNGFIFKRAADIAAEKRLEGSLMMRYREVMDGLFHGISRDTASALRLAGSFTGATGENGAILAAAPYRDIMSNTTMWTYLPSVIGFTLARVFGGSFVTEVMCARWANLIMAALFITLGLWKCPYGKRGFAAAALFPMLIQMISSCSYDAMIIGYGFLFIGYAFHVLMESDISVSDLIVLVLSASQLLQNKHGVYIPVVALLLLLPAFRKKKRYRWLTLGVILAGAAAFMVLYAPYLSGFSAAAAADPEGGNYTAAYFVTHPLRFLHIVENTALLQGDDLLMSTIAYWLGSGRIYVPTYAVAVIAVLAWLSAHERDQDRTAAPGRRARIWMGIFIVIGILFMDLAFLISMTSAGGNVVPGLQGRYFLPYALLLLLILSGDSLPGHVKNPNCLIFWIECVQFFIVVFAFRYLFAYSA